MLKKSLAKARSDINNYRLMLMGGIVRFEDSSAIKSVAYDRAANVLEIVYNHGGVYDYYGVEPQTFRKFVKAESKGKYLHAHIRNEYAFERVV